MITRLKCTQFRNFHNREFLFHTGNNFIIGENGQWKTNILEALSLISWNSITWLHFDSLVETGHDFFHLEAHDSEWNVLQLFYDSALSKKKYTLNGKSTTKKKFLELSPSSVTFSPILMNIFYLWPSPRRDYFDSILGQSFEDYTAINKKFKQCVQQRNKILKNISAWFSKNDELTFWDEQFVVLWEYIYKKRKHLLDFIIANKEKLGTHLENKISKIDIHYISKINIYWDIKDQLRTQLRENLPKDILLRTTTIWPHRDDFCIMVNMDVPLTDFASRWEVKTAILALKNIEIDYIEYMTHNKPLLIIDDLLSELDETNKALFINNCQSYQTFISSITHSPEMIAPLILNSDSSNILQNK